MWDLGIDYVRTCRFVLFVRLPLALVPAEDIVVRNDHIAACLRFPLALFGLLGAVVFCEIVLRKVVCE